MPPLPVHPHPKRFRASAIQIWIAVALLLFSLTADTQPLDCPGSMLGPAYLQRDLDGLVARFEGLTDVEQWVAGYLIAVTALADDDRKTARRYVERSLEAYRKHPAPGPAGQAAASLLYGQLLRMRPMLGIVHGDKPAQLLSDAEAGMPEAPLVVFARASFLHRTPKTFGGAPEESLARYRLLLQPVDAPSKAKCWLEIAGRNALIEVYQSLGRSAEAQTEQAAARRLTPGNRWLPAEDDGPGTESAR